MNNLLTFKDNTALEYFFTNMDEVGGSKNTEETKGQALAKVPAQAWWQPAITMFLKLSVWIAAPVIIALYIGKWLDKKFGSEPWLFLAFMGLAFAVSIFGLIRNTARELKKFENEKQSLSVIARNEAKHNDEAISGKKN